MPLTSTTRGLRAASAALTTGAYSPLDAYLADLSLASVQTGFESGEVIETLLLCKDAVLPVIRRVYAADLETAWAMISELDACLRWVVARFNVLYETEMNRRMGKQHEQIMRMLKRVQEMSGPFEMDEILRHIAEGIVTAAATDHCNFYLVSDDQNRFIPKLGVGNASLPPAHIRNFLERPPDPKTDPFLRHVLEHREPLTSYDTLADPRVNHDVVGPMGVKSILAVPFVAHDQVVAVAMTGALSGHRTFTGEQVELAWNVARAAALVIENTRLHEERLAEHESIRRVANALLQELELDEVLKVISAEAQQLTGATKSTVYFLDGEELQLVFSAGEKPYHERIPVTGSMTGRALREGRPLMSNNPANDRRLFRLDPDTKNMLTAPLRTNSRTIGILFAANKPWDFTEDDARIVGLFADQAAIAIENARLHEKTRQVGVLEERERLAREIHDNVAQSLSVLKLQASHVGDLLGSGQIEQANVCLDEMKKTVTEAHADARDAIFSLRSSAASTPEFLSMLRAHLERYRSVYGLETQLVVQDEPLITLSSAAVVQSTRIIQEALTNVRKHAGASAVSVRLERVDGHLAITVEDDGRGFAPTDPDDMICGCRGVGLQIMQERADSLGGSLEVETAPGQGTRIVAHIPLSDRR